ncbi:hypothetical protein IJ182_06470 [bacterium]|nr:hypothetical protein [bacterium]
MIELYSFDIFDTLITRKVATPKGIFAIIKHIINTDNKYNNIPDDIKENFFEYRINSELQLRQINETELIPSDITIEEIYNRFSLNYNLPIQIADILKELETEIEIKNLIPINENIEKIEKLVNEGKRVVLISDMYLPYSVIKGVLCSFSKVFENIKIYLSSSVGYMKSKGGIYEYVHSIEKVEYSNWLHIGDNIKSDYDVPLKFGINTQLYNYVEFKEYEKYALDKYANNVFVQLTIGCAKNVRLLSKNRNEKFQLGVSLAGVFFYPYIKWVLEQSDKNNINCLYFIARDGYILKEIADIIIKDDYPQITTEYLYGSRKAWRTTFDINDIELRKQFVISLLWTHQKIDSVCNLNKKDFLKILPSKFHNYTKGFGPTKLAKFRELLINSDEFFKLLLQNNSDKKLLVLKYLKQEITKNIEKNIAFVDLDGSGFSQNCMSKIVRSFYDKNLISYYMFSTTALFHPVNIHSKYFSSLKKPLIGNIVELFTRAPHGQTLGYKEINEKVEPILDQFDIDVFNNWQFNEYLNGIKAYISLINKYKNEYPCISFDNQFFVNLYLNYIVENVDENTANLIGNIIHSYSGKENKEFAPKINNINALKYLFFDKIDTENIFISRMRSNSFVKSVIDYKQHHPKFRKDIINVLVNPKKKIAVITILWIKINLSNIIWKENIEI